MSKDPLSSILFAALEIPSGADRCRFLDESCGADSEVRSQVDALLDALPHAEGFLSSPEFRPTVISDDDNTPPNASILQALGKDLPQIVLDDSMIDGDPIIRPSSPELPETNAGSRYQLQGEIARGGMGAILKGRDIDLGRNIAIKVLLEAHRDNSQTVQRFVEEAQIGGQLQHPGIAPVYQLGQFPDRRPFFTMKFVKGRTLAALLSDRENPADERNRLLGVFEQVCQTMAYAHSRGVVHRDLKPANIMVGAFGEVQVMDWGLAKVLNADGTASEAAAPEKQPDLSVIQTVRSVGSDAAMVGTDAAAAGETQMGSVMGTPAYMPPEQALGEVDRLDERCDVFGLGSILVEILTGKPAYASEDSKELLRMASRGKLDDCFLRLDAGGVDFDLIAVARQCLGLEPEDRFRDAGEVAAQITGYLESVEARLRDAELKRATDATRAVEEQRRRKFHVALAGSIVMLVGLCSGGWMWISSQQTQERLDTLEQVRDSIGTSELHRELAKDRDPQSRLSELDVAVAEAERAVETAGFLPETDDVRRQAEQNLAEIQQEQRAAAEEYRRIEESETLRAELEAIRVRHADGKRKLRASESDQFDIDGLDAHYQNAFAAAGYDFEQLTVAAAAERIRESRVTETIISALDHWARSMPKSSGTDVARAWMSAGNWDSATRAYEDRILANPDDSIAWMGLAASQAVSGDIDAYRRTCDEMIQRFADHEVSHHGERVTKMCLLFPDQYDPEELPTERWIRELDDNLVSQSYRVWYTICRAMLEFRRKNPEAGLLYANAALDDPVMQQLLLARPYATLVKAMCEHELAQQSAERSLGEARRLIEELIANVSSRGHHDTAIAMLLFEEASGKIAPDESAQLEMTAASSSESLADLPPVLRRERLRPYLLQIANAADDSAWRRSIREALEEEDEVALISLATAEDAAGQPPAITVWLGKALQSAGQSELAITILRAAQEKHPSDFWLNFELARSLAVARQPEAAISYARTAVAIRPGSNAANWCIVSVLDDLGRTEESLQLFRQLLSRQDLSSDELTRLSQELGIRGRLQQAEACAQKAILLQEDNVAAYKALGRCLLSQERYDDAIQAARKGVSFLPRWDEVDDPDTQRTARNAFFSLGFILNRAEAVEEAVEAYRSCIEFDPTYSPAYNNLGLALRDLGRLDEAEKKLRQAWRLDPASRHATSNLLSVLMQLVREQGPRPEWQDDIRKLRGLSEINRERGIAQYRSIVKLNPRDAETRRFLARQLLKTEQISEAEIHAAIAAELSPSAITFQIHARTLFELGRLDEADVQFRKAVAAGPKSSEHLQLAIALHNFAIGRLGSEFLPPLLTEGQVVEQDRDWFLSAAIEQYQAYFGSEHDDSNTEMMMRAGFVSALKLNGQTERAAAEEQKIHDSAVAMLNEFDGHQFDFMAMFSMVRSLRTVGMEDAAVDLLERFHQMQPDDVRIAAQAGALLMRDGRYDEARRIGKSMIERKDQLVDGYILLTRLHLKQEEYAEAHALLDQGLAAVSDSAAPAGTRRIPSGQRRSQMIGDPQPSRPTRSRRPATPAADVTKLRMQKAQVYYREGKFQEAMAEFEAIPARRNGTAVFSSAKCMVMYELGDHDEAIVAARDGLRSGSASARNTLAWLYLVEPDDDGRFSRAAEAVILAKRAVGSALVDSATASVRNTLGLAYYRIADYESALRELTLSVKDLDEEANWLALAMTHWQLGDMDEARKWLARAEDEQKIREFFRAQRNLLAEARQLIRPESQSSTE